MTIFSLFRGFFAQNRAIFVRKDGFYPSKNGKKWSKNVIFRLKSRINRLFCRHFCVFYGFYPQK